MYGQLSEVIMTSPGNVHDLFTFFITGESPVPIYAPLKLTSANLGVVDDWLPDAIPRDTNTTENPINSHRILLTSEDI